MRKQETIGDLQFWREVIVYYRTSAKRERKLKHRIRLAKCLNEARGNLKYAESKLLIVLVLAVILSGCVSTIRGLGQGVKGIGQGTGTIVTGVGDFLIDEMEGK